MRAAFVAIFTLAISVGAFAQRNGYGMLHDCNLAIAHDDGKQLDDIEKMKVMRCEMYVAGFLDAVQVYKILDLTTLFCLPTDRIPIKQAVRIFANYLGAHPEELNKGAGFLLTRSLQEAFPCKEENKPE